MSVWKSDEVFMLCNIRRHADYFLTSVVPWTVHVTGSRKHAGSVIDHEMPVVYSKLFSYNRSYRVGGGRQGARLCLRSHELSSNNEGNENVEI